MRIQLPDTTIVIDLQSKNTLDRVRCIKSVLTMILSYWIEKSESPKTYYKRVYDRNLELARLRNLRVFANPRLINFLLLTRQDGRRLNEINDSLYGALEHAMDYEARNPYLCPRMLSIGHAFSHFDSILDETEGLGNPNKAHSLLDILILYANKPFDEVEIGIFKALTKSRIRIFLEKDYKVEVFEKQVGNQLKRLREMFLSSIVIDLISEISELKNDQSFNFHIVKFKNELKSRVKHYSTKANLPDYNFLDFMNAFVGSIRSDSGYEDSDLHKMRMLLSSMTQDLGNHCSWIKEIIALTDKDPFNTQYLESSVLPKFDEFLTEILAEYY
ncbi:hypothetical protein H6G51_06435 [Limnothrix sp. FACHB-708]|uniref:hypothetical protein n=1 Tax=unclassified Limnothrix TaxID=2632864 RepID=UPI0016867029|nr:MULTISPECIES: hypothetical protein [unclassified Limnothrix]MBD2552909.1 hypothetical protein [Limnothrix sp. FACHB-708]MBD2589279.1 hypothetical protein [Limnothrix sp. FACHB-406]